MGTDDYIIDANGSWSSPQEALEWYRVQPATERAALQENSTCIWQQDGEGRPITKTDQVRMCGNSVCPPLAAALVSAQFNEQRQRRWA